MRDESITAAWPIMQYADGVWTAADDEVAEEKPLTIRLDGREFATIVCSPSDREDLLYGFLASEGVILTAGDVASVDWDEGTGMADVALARKMTLAEADFGKRIIGSCCGKSRQFYLRVDAKTAKTSVSRVTVTPEECIAAMDELQRSSGVFARTGGVHNAALYVPGTGRRRDEEGAETAGTAGRDADVPELACTARRGHAEGAELACTAGRGHADGLESACTAGQDADGPELACTAGRGHEEGAELAGTAGRGHEEGAESAGTAGRGHEEGAELACTAGRGHEEGAELACTAGRGHEEGAEPSGTAGRGHADGPAGMSGTAPSVQGGLLAAVRSDIGRHNALDKLYGHCIRNGIPGRDKAIVFSGRLSSEVVIKTAKIGAALLIAKSAPTALALRLAHDLGITAVGFVRGGRLNVYTHAQRIVHAV